MPTIKELQAFIGVPADGVWGPKSKLALDAIVSAVPTLNGWHKVKASSFADPADVRAFERCKAEGKSDMACFAVGDNGIGKWGHKTAQEHTPMAALPPEIWRAANKTGGSKLLVKYNDRIVPGILGDTMPAQKNVTNGAGIDLNPAFAKMLGLKPPFMAEVEWCWS